MDVKSNMKGLLPYYGACGSRDDIERMPDMIGSVHVSIMAALPGLEWPRSNELSVETRRVERAMLRGGADGRRSKCALRGAVPGRRPDGTGHDIIKSIGLFTLNDHT
jgi:hypothetical protein